MSSVLEKEAKWYRFDFVIANFAAKISRPKFLANERVHIKMKSQGLVACESRHDRTLSLLSYFANFTCLATISLLFYLWGKS